MKNTQVKDYHSSAQIITFEKNGVELNSELRLSYCEDYV